MTAVRDLSPDDAEALTDLYRDYEWWADREVDRVRAALVGSDVALGLEADGDLVAAARVVTDYTYYGMVYDVIVAADRRGQGFGAELMAAIRDHPRLRTLPGLSLLCREGLVPFYESIGFQLGDPEVAFPEGGEEKLVRMTYERAE